MARKNTVNYVDNSELTQLVKEYIESNPNDNGEWLDKYEGTMTKKCQKKADKADDVKDFIEFRRKLYNSKRPFEKYESVCAKLLPKIYEIIDGRMASYKIFDDPDMRQDALVMFMRYINRYDWRKNTSAFAYITEIITNSINLTLKKRAKDYLDGAIVLESQLEDKVLVSMFKGMDTEGYGTTDE